MPEKILIIDAKRKTERIEEKDIILTKETGEIKGGLDIRKLIKLIEYAEKMRWI